MVRGVMYTPKLLHPIWPDHETGDDHYICEHYQHLLLCAHSPSGTPQVRYPNCPHSFLSRLVYHGVNIELMGTCKERRERTENCCVAPDLQYRRCCPMLMRLHNKTLWIVHIAWKSKNKRWLAKVPDIVWMGEQEGDGSGSRARNKMKISAKFNLHMTTWCDCAWATSIWGCAWLQS